MIRPSTLSAAAVLASSALLLFTSCTGTGPKSGGIEQLKPDLVVASASVKITGSGRKPGTMQCDVEVVIENRGQLAVEPADGPFVVVAHLVVQKPRSDAYLPPLLTSPGSTLTGTGPSAHGALELVTSGPLDVGRSKALHAAGVLETRGYSDLQLVVTVDDCSTGRPCRIDESNEDNNTLVQSLGDIGKAP